MPNKLQLGGRKAAVPQVPAWLDFRSVLESTSDCIYVLDRKWRYAYLNARAIAEIAEGRNLLGRNIWKAFPELSQTKFAGAFRSAMADGNAAEVADFYGPLGHSYAVSIRPFAEGLVIFFRRGDAQDISETALEIAERRFQSMFSSLTLGVMFQDTKGIIVQVNPAAERILGMSRPALIGRTTRDPLWAFVDADGVPFTQANFPGYIALATRQAVVRQIIGIFNPALNERRWLLVDAVPLFDEKDGSPRHLCSIFSDITDQRLAQKTLRDSQANLSLAQRVASVGSTFLDAETGEVVWSDETYRLFGVDKNTFVPSVEAVVKLVHPDDRAKYIEVLETVGRAVVPHPLEYRIIRPDGELRVIYREADVVRAASGKITGVIATSRDVTELRAAEHQREALQIQLYHAQRLDSLGTLASGIAHDLNNTLVPILGLSEAMLKTSAAASPQKPLLELIHKAGERARDLVRQILLFSRRGALNNRMLEVTPFLRETMRLVRASVPTSIIIKERFSKIPPVWGDSSQLHQVVLNLITNAAQAIGDAPGLITVEVAKAGKKPMDGPGGVLVPSVRISISDNGCGMDEQTRERIFEPFYSTKPAGVGTGLGLSVVHGIVTGYGGRITVSSTPGRGSRFDVYLPAAEQGLAQIEANRDAA